MSTPARPGWLRRLVGLLLAHRADLVVALVAAVVGSACQAVVPLVEREVVDRVVIARTSSLTPWLVVLLVLAIGVFGAAYLRRYHGGRLALAVQNDLRTAMHAHLLGLDQGALSQLPTGQLVSRASSDTALVQGLLSFLPLLSGNLLLMVISLGVMLVLSPLLAVVSLVVAPVLLLVSYRMRRRIFPATWDAQQREGELVQIVDEDVNGVRVVKAFGQERRELERVARSAETLYGAQMRAVRLQSRYQPLLAAVPTLGQVAILALGGWLALRGSITVGTFLAFSTYVGQLLAPARQLAGVLTIGQQARAGLERVFQLLDRPSAIADPPGAVQLPTLRGEITFSGVVFGYGEGEPVLDGLDLHLAPGERVAVVGPSGSGKSTLTTLVPRFADPQEGAVLVDGHDVRDVALVSLRRQIGVVPEDSFLFSDTVRANLAYGRPDATDAEVEAAARVAQAHEFVLALPHGYDTVVGERGLSLSGGQRQRLALARAVLSDPRILLLDDATSAVDARTEEAVNEALRRVMAGRTTLLVAHRRSTLHLADRVVVLDAGRIVDSGSHEELLERSALYRALLTGLDEDLAEQVGDRVEALVTLAAPVSPAAPAVRPAPPSLGAGLGPGGGSWRLNLPPTPELLAAVEALPPVRDEVVVDVDEEQHRRSGFSLGGVLREFRRPLLVGLVLVVLDALASLAGPVLVKTGIDGGVGHGSGRTLTVAVLVFLLVVAAAFLVEVAQTFVTGRTAQQVMLSLRVRVWAQLQRLSLGHYEREMAGRIMTRMTTDVDQFSTLIENGLLSALVAGVTFLGVGVALVVLDVELGLCVLAVVVPLAFATAAFRRRAATLYDEARDRIALVNADFQESLSGVREAQAFVHEAPTRERFRGLCDRYLSSRVGAQRLVAIYFPFVQLLSAVADAVVLGVGASLVHSGHLTAGALLAYLLYLDLFFSPVQQLSQVFDAWQQTRISTARIAELLALTPLVDEAPDAVDPGRLSGSVVLEDVRFAYPVQQESGSEVAARRGPADPRVLAAAPAARPPEALRGVSLTVRPGETVALVGETGAGKSTVVKLLARFYDPQGGRVLLGGRDVRSLDLGAFRRQLGYVPQESFLFSGTVRDNIAYGRPDASFDEVRAAARAVGADTFIAGLPGGYDAVVSERGRSLSAGQRQLLALARAELVDPVVLLLDEATSNLDLATEARVARAMQQVSSGRTTFVIAHRLQTARSADRIVVLGGGRVQEVGSHDQLLARGGVYASMWRAFEELGGRPGVAAAS